MRRLKVFVLLAVMAAALLAQAAAADPQPLVLVIHGGAGVIERARMTPEREAGYRAGLRRRSMPATRSSSTAAPVSMR